MALLLHFTEEDSESPISPKVKWKGGVTECSGGGGGGGGDVKDSPILNPLGNSRAWVLSPAQMAEGKASWFGEREQFTPIYNFGFI